LSPLFGRGEMGNKVRRKKKEGRKAGRILEDVMSFIAHDAKDPGLYLGFGGWDGVGYLFWVIL
jgi:hypothetical protein